ncbi:transcriptional regulator [Cutibacterium acnes JCM 18909]|nr:transcriptional regulator [Cutibacterium acnes JCM 18909]
MAESKGSAHGSLYTRLGELQAMTPTDAIIAQYCEDSFPHVALENLDEISAATGTSTASVTRFVRKLGYASFRDFSRSFVRRSPLTLTFLVIAQPMTPRLMSREPCGVPRWKLSDAALILA